MLIQASIQALQSHVPLNEQQIEDLLEIPPNANMGDIAFPCFQLSKMLKKSPVQIAQELAKQVTSSEIQAEAAGPYVNLRFNRYYFSEQILEELSTKGWSVPNLGQGDRVVIDMSSPNIAKPFGIGHLRSTIIGAALYKMYQLTGYEVISVNHIGDWGTQFGKQITAFKRWGDEKALQDDPIAESLKLYVRFHEEAEQDASLDPEARDWFRKLEAGDEEAVRLWTYFVQVSMEEFNRMYERLNIQFDYTLGESFYNDKMGAVVESLQNKGLLEESDGALVVRLDEQGMPPCLILKKDGTTIYPTRDLATAFYRHDVMKADRILYVVGKEQTLHFEQVFAVLKKMEAAWVEKCTHVGFGLMKFEGKKMSTRRGKIVVLEDVLDEAAARALQTIEDKNTELENKQEVAEAIGLGAIIFGDLKNNRTNEVDFSLEEALNFDGETGPYVQYTYARTQSILSKHAASGYQEDIKQCEQEESELLGDSGWELLKILTRYAEQLVRGVQKNEPSVLARYVVEVAQAFNKYYNKERILTENMKLREARLALTQLTGEILSTILHILGLQTPERM
ncbi:arginine--tRNA ligase [Paenibacillus pini]|uniref:Arginine--tRNA ligase n=1 Tax=Paenibacillus pini JCM 16418 TaxID=1236976 RepID=W7YA60_9BACL|nr:arginine--tRNA ligase [Paenibacillus pini]GAF07930.1 arginyl-tRNA synthetase [Paenibacillus pini JCM 16418]